jgi:hypothetical protein
MHRQHFEKSLGKTAYIPYQPVLFLDLVLFCIVAHVLNRAGSSADRSRILKQIAQYVLTRRACSTLY